MVKKVKFIVDCMLGKLTRWLRMLGYDVKYSRSLGDNQLIKTAKMEHRTLLTRDIKLYKQALMQGINTFFIEGETGVEKLANLAKQSNITVEIDVAVSRCPKCNTRIRPIPKDRVINKVPRGTLVHSDKFWKCPNCKQIYWHGAHWKQITETLKHAKQIVEHQGKK